MIKNAILSIIGENAVPIEALLLMSAFLVGLRNPRLGQKAFKKIAAVFRRFAAKKKRAVLSVGLFVFLGAALYGFIEGFPIPYVQDESSYLLAADTFASGRLTNPTHPLWQHFESFHIFHEPTYMSKYPVGQGLFLAFGQFFLGHPIWGVWISAALATAALCWMLQAWLPARWALFGSILFAFRIAIFTYWAQSYWGGMVAMLGGCLVFGAIRRLVRKPEALTAILLGIGLGILANSRPFEGALVSLPVTAIILWKCLKAKEQGWATKVVLPIGIVLAIVVSLMGYYNYRVTGKATKMPYHHYEETYNSVPMFVWESEPEKKEYRHKVMETLYDAWYENVYENKVSFKKRTQETFSKVASLWYLTFGFALTFPFLLSIPFIFRNRWMLFAGGVSLFLVAVLFYTTWALPHYCAPAVSLCMVLGLQGMRYLRFLTFQDKPLGAYMSRAIPLICTIFFVYAFFASMVISKIPFSLKQYQIQNGETRHQVQKRLENTPGKHVVFVHYADSHNVNREWVYNRADIDAAKVVWAHDMGDEKNQELADYFTDRKAWMIWADRLNSEDLTAYSPKENRSSS